MVARPHFECATEKKFPKPIFELPERAQNVATQVSTLVLNYPKIIYAGSITISAHVVLVTLVSNFTIKNVVDLIGGTYQ